MENQTTVKDKLLNIVEGFQQREQRKTNLIILRKKEEADNRIDETEVRKIVIAVASPEMTQETKQIY